MVAVDAIQLVLVNFWVIICEVDANEALRVAE
jgi:hypothetical protein